MTRLSFLIIFAVAVALGAAQPAPVKYAHDLDYFLPPGNYTYNPEVPTPEQVLGFQIGQQHVDWGNVVTYMKALADVSPRVSMRETGRTYQHRPFIEVIFTSAENQKNIEQLREEHLKLTETSESSQLDTENMPVVVSLIYSIHGNEPSGVNSSLAVAYWLAAAQGDGMEKLLDSTIVSMTPGANPDGINRFASWVNSSRSLTDVGDANSRELVEPWPSSRTNHYWADCNRDLIMLQHPEGHNALNVYFNWMPNVVADIHEQGSARQYYFSPGHPKRKHKFISQYNQELASKVSDRVAGLLDGIGTGYYSKEGYDDYYFGKSACYGDSHGSVALLYEQGTSRGHLRNTVNGPRSFAWTVRNQAYGSYGTIFAAYEIRQELLDFQRDFYKENAQVGASEKVKGYVFNTRGNKGVRYHLLDNLNRQQIDVYKLAKDNGKFSKEDALVIPVNQKNRLMVKALFEDFTDFSDSVFYDISSWTLPYAFNLDFTPVNNTTGLLGDRVTENIFEPGKVIGDKSDYGYLFDLKEYYAPKIISELKKRGMWVNVSGKPFKFHSDNETKDFGYGTVQVMSQNQPLSSDSIFRLMQQLAVETGVDVHSVTTGLMEAVDLYSPSYLPVESPKVAVLVGRTMGVPDSGEVWYLLDYRFQMQPTMIENLDLTAKKLSPYNVIILANGVPSLSKNATEVLKEWVAAGGTLIATGKAWKWVKDNELMNIRVKPIAKTPLPDDYRAYENKKSDNSHQSIDGVFMRCGLDRTHPLAWGLDQDEIMVLKNNNIIFEKDDDIYASPLHYAKNPVVSGYASAENRNLLSDAPAVITKPYKSGRVIVFADDMNFRSYMFGTSKIFLNAIFFGSCIK